MTVKEDRQDRWVCEVRREPPDLKDKLDCLAAVCWERRVNPAPMD